MVKHIDITSSIVIMSTILIITSQIIASAPTSNDEESEYKPKSFN